MSSDHELSDLERSNLVASAREAVIDLLEQQKTLRSATSALGDPFTLRVVDEAFAQRSSDDDVRIQVAALSWAATACCNQFNRIMQAGIVLAGFREPDPPGEPPPSVTQDYRLLRDNGVIAESQRRLLGDLNAARIALTHRYGEPATPQELHTAASLAGKLLSTFQRVYAPWLRELGVLPPPKK